MKKVTIDIKNIFSSLRNWRKKILYVFWAIFFFMLFLEFFKIQDALYFIRRSKESPDFLVKSQGVRVNFQGYEKSIERIEKGNIYIPKSKNLVNPFSGK